MKTPLSVLNAKIICIAKEEILFKYLKDSGGLMINQIK